MKSRIVWLTPRTKSIHDQSSKRKWCPGSETAGAGGGGTIIALTLTPERTINALKEGAEEFIELDPNAKGIVSVPWISQ